MKVVQINAVCDYGSTGRIVSEISEYLDDHGVDNIILYGNGTSDRSNAKKIGNGFDHKIHALLSRITGKQGYFSKHATKKTLEYIDSFKPDIIHLHNLHGNYINLPVLFKYIIDKQIPVVITLHDCFFFTGKCVHYLIADCYRWQESCGHCPQLKNGNISWFFDRTAKMLKDKKEWYDRIKNIGVIGVSRWITGEARGSILRSSKELETIYNWIDLDKFYPHVSDVRKKLQIQSKYIILGVSISWSSEKGIDDFNRLADMLSDDFVIILVGAKTENINKKIFHIPRTTDIKMLSDLYAAADVFYNPTRRETFGKVTAEALSCGTPVVAYNTTACTELVPEECGYIEQIGDVDAVCKDIYDIVNSDYNYEKSCREFAERNFDKGKGLMETLNLYNRLIVE